MTNAYSDVAIASLRIPPLLALSLSPRQPLRPSFPHRRRHRVGVDPSSLIPSIKSLTLSLNLRRNLRRDGQKLRKLMTPVEIIQMGWRKEDVGSNFDGWEKEWSEADVEMLKKTNGEESGGETGTMGGYR
ncbi:hypothetical protein GQ457_18G007800 [Hibiscus cannabinus]